MAAPVALAGDQVRSLLAKWDDVDEPLAPISDIQNELLEKFEALPQVPTEEKVLFPKTDPMTFH